MALKSCLLKKLLLLCQWHERIAFLPTMLHVHRLVHADGHLDLELLVLGVLADLTLVPLGGLARERRGCDGDLS